MLTAADSPRALNEFVGFCPSSLTYSFVEAELARRSGCACSSGVMPLAERHGRPGGMTSS